jgi:hypothetical protein
MTAKSGTAEYGAWLNMRRCCNYPKAKGWKYYGGRGICVCPEWQASFDAFYRHVGPRPSPQHSIDRIFNDGHYEPGNVRAVG